MRTTLILAALLLAGCETSAVWYASHPDKQTITVDGKPVNVVPRGPGKYDAWGGDDGTKTSTPELKQRHIRAVEIASHCTVSGSEYAPGTWTLQAVVICP